MNRFELVGDVASNNRMSHGARIGQMHDEARRNRSLEWNGEGINWGNHSHSSSRTSKRGIRSCQILKIRGVADKQRMEPVACKSRNSTAGHCTGLGCERERQACLARQNQRKNGTGCLIQGNRVQGCEDRVRGVVVDARQFSWFGRDGQVTPNWIEWSRLELKVKRVTVLRRTQLESHLGEEKEGRSWDETGGEKGKGKKIHRKVTLAYQKVRIPAGDWRAANRYKMRSSDIHRLPIKWIVWRIGIQGHEVNEWEKIKEDNSGSWCGTDGGLDLYHR